MPSSSKPRNSDLIGRAVALGGLCWLAALVVVTILNSRRLARVLFPLMEPISSLAGPGFNMGTAEHPRYEWTPVQGFATFAGVASSALIYMALTYIWFRWRNSPASSHDGDA